ncbi:tyrosine-type recombinase/integrase [Pseudorhodobacter sp. W20_MBD10_FR17]|uniref:tyrosine-type recombinase/integrase n=1 Tax=Pseudorhodobacter sp. W20_MBD10_FR17 TaxID=3240266 RepID=UPI003F9579BD
MAKALTTKGIEALKADPEKRLEISDASCRGLYIVIQPSGSKSWALRYRVANKPAKLTLGRWPSMGLGDARAAAGVVLESIDRGNDPAAMKRAEKAKSVEAPDRDSVGEVIRLFMKRHASRNRRADDVMAMFTREIIGPWGDRPIQSITKRDVLAILDGIVDRGSPVTANRLRAHMNTLFNWAKGRDIIKDNPLDGIRPPAPEKARDRVLTDEEVKLVWGATGEMGYPFGPMIRLLLLTGARLREVAEMPRAEINLTGDVWTLPASRSKNGDEHVVPLSPEAQAIISEIPKIGRGKLLFTTTGETPVSGFTRAKTKLVSLMTEAANRNAAEGDEPVVIPQFTLHDLRRTAATGMAALRFAPHVVEAVLNHKSGTRRGIASVYNRHDHLDEKREALTGWGRYVFELVNGTPTNVISLIAAGCRDV